MLMYALTNNEDYNLINIEERNRIFEVGFFKHKNQLTTCCIVHIKIHLHFDSFQCRGPVVHKPVNTELKYEKISSDHIL